MIGDLSFQAGVVDPKAINLLHDRLVVRQEVSGLIGKSINFGLGRFRLSSTLLADIEDLVNGRGVQGRCDTQGAAGDAGR